MAPDSDYIFIDMLKGAPWSRVADQVPESDGTRLKRELGRYVGRFHTDPSVLRRDDQRVSVRVARGRGAAQRGDPGVIVHE
ncbi:hypothetical protein GCM10025762_13930 [Haloechinothrix salitolerans]